MAIAACALGHGRGFGGGPSNPPPSLGEILCGALSLGRHRYVTEAAFRLEGMVRSARTCSRCGAHFHGWCQGDGRWTWLRQGCERGGCTLEEKRKREARRRGEGGPAGD